MLIYSEIKKMALFFCLKIHTCETIGMKWYCNICICCRVGFSVDHVIFKSYIGITNGLSDSIFI
jgi:hypothetical protein